MTAIDQAFDRAKSETIGLAKAVGARIAQEVARHGHSQEWVDSQIASAMGQLREGFEANGILYKHAMALTAIMTDILAAELRRHGIPFTPPNSTATAKEN